MNFDTTALVNWMKLTRVEDTSQVPPVVDAVVSMINSLPDPPRLPPVDPETVGDWAAETELAALMLGARLFRRRNSPAGIEAFNESGATYVSRYDSDIARMLKIDIFTKPAVG